MKAFIISIIIIAIQFSCFGQAKLTMSKYRYFLPADTVSFGTNVQLQVFVKNTGNVPFSGTIKLTAKRDTASIGGIVLDTITISSANLLPNSGDSIPGILQFTPSFTPSLGTFKVMGNGNVIVVWPISGPTLLGDSVRHTLFIDNLTGIKELKENEISIYPNPVSNLIHVALPNKQTIKSYVIYDVYGRKVRDVQMTDEINVSELNNGLYWMILFTDNKSYKTKIIKQ
jgi:hypothetical protein